MNKLRNIKQTTELETLLEKYAKRIADQHIIHRASQMLREIANTDLVEKYDLADAYGSYNEDEDEFNEIREHWIVSDLLFRQLKDCGETVFELFDFKIWGRRISGQATYLDNCIKQIAYNLWKNEIEAELQA
jgi:ribosomal protein S19E (S16A)